MKRVDIYVETSIHGPKRRNGAIGYLAEYITENGLEASKGKIETVENMVEHDSILTAIVKALGTVKQGQEITVHTDSEWIVSAINKWLREWERNGWVTRKGEDVKHKELFEEVAKRKKTDLITVEHGIGAKYGSWLKTEVIRKEKEEKHEKH